ncbi:MAG: cupin domain-containing protein [Alphaproteobacteria bacterium]|nr:cupin domain-containing protein [Alphaproteobacteria bacterium]
MIVVKTAPDKAARSHYVDVEGMEWQPSAFPRITCKVLFTEPATGRSTILFRMAPGAIVPAHFHQGIEQTFILEGSLEDHLGIATAGNFVWREPGSYHEARAPGGALVLGVFDQPNRFDEDVPWYAEGKRAD